MPQRDTTGPMGQGRMTGREMGICLGYGIGRYGIGLRSGNGFGMGANDRCHRGLRRFNIEENIVSEKELLQRQKELLEKRVEIVTRQIEKLS